MTLFLYQSSITVFSLHKLTWKSFLRHRRTEMTALSLCAQPFPESSQKGSRVTEGSRRVSGPASQQHSAVVFLVTRSNEGIQKICSRATLL